MALPERHYRGDIIVMVDWTATDGVGTTWVNFCGATSFDLNIDNAIQEETVPTAADLGKFLDEHDKLVEEAQRRAWLFGFIKTVALWMTAVAGGLAVIKGYLNDLGGKP